MTKEECLCHIMDDESVIFLDGYDDCIIGIVRITGPRVAYSYNKISVQLQEDGCSYDEADEMISYNIERAIDYMGPSAPVIVFDQI